MDGVMESLSSPEAAVEGESRVSIPCAYTQTCYEHSRF